MIAALEINGLSVAHGKKSVFEKLSLHVAPKEIFGLFGVNGAGKTSLMKAALSLLEPVEGDVRFFGVSHKTPESRRKTAYLPENFRPPSAMSGVQFLRLVLGLHMIAFDRTLADSLARAVDLDPGVLDRRIATLSKGMAQKLGLLAAFLTGCPLLILDEPLNGLDPRARIMLKKQMQTYRAAGNSILLTSHILADLEELCDHVAVLHEGAIRFSGEPGELRRQYAGATLEQAFLAVIGAQTQ